jgi:hypothetical protein
MAFPLLPLPNDMETRSAELKGGLLSAEKVEKGNLLFLNVIIRENSFKLNPLHVASPDWARRNMALSVPFKIP